jgi:uncharacterized membrane protein (UPF0182 family)
MSAKRGILWVLAGVALALLGGRWLAGMYGDWAFHDALGSTAVWRSALITGTALRLSIVLVVFGFTFVNLFAVRQSIVSLAVPRSVGGVDFTEAVPPERLTLFAVGGATIIAIVFAFVEQDWSVARIAFAGVRFGEFDPYLERDLAFYVHWLPFERLWNGIFSVLVVVVAILVLLLYAITPSIRWDANGLYVSAWVRRHLGILAGVAIALVGWEWRLDRFTLITEGGSATTLFEAPTAFSSFDHRTLLPYLAVISFAALPVAVVFAWAAWRGLIRVAFALATGLIVAGPVMRLLLPALAGGDAAPDVVAARERPYRSTQSLFTRRAYGVDQIAGAETLQVRSVGLTAMPRSVGSWDPIALMRAIAFERRGTDVAAIAWSGGRAGLESVLLRAAPPDAAPGARWPLDRVLAAGADPSGAPVEVPGAGERGIASILVAPGGGRYALVADTTGRLAAPAFETTLQRVALAWSLQNPRLLAAEAPGLRPRLMVRRDVRDRVRALTPFLTLGETVTPIVRDDSLYWAVELFVVAREYPLAERVLFEGRRAHYVRHAATAVVQAQTGAVLLYAVARPDPVMAAWMRIFPDHFVPRANVPAWLHRTLPPAVDWALVQGMALGRAGFEGDTLSARTLARVDDADADLAVGPPARFQLDTNGTMAWGIPVVDATDQVTGLLVARGGVLAGTDFHHVSTGIAWTRVLERLQAAADSAGFGRALPNSRRGRVQAIPVSGGAAFVQSFYDWPSDQSPRLAGVAVLHEGRTRVGRTFAAAMGVRDDASMTPLPADVLRRRAAALYDQMTAAQRAGDWRTYGEAWAALGRLLGRPPK